jgi:ABC-type transport system involved in Fe-S cluster assembly fused permease/ATPase subunit
MGIVKLILLFFYLFDRKLQLMSFKILRLSLKYHLSRKTGEMLRIVSRGTDSVNNMTT